MTCFKTSTFTAALARREVLHLDPMLLSVGKHDEALPTAHLAYGRGIALPVRPREVVANAGGVRVRVGIGGGWRRLPTPSPGTGRGRRCAVGRWAVSGREGLGSGVGSRRHSADSLRDARVHDAL